MTRTRRHGTGARAGLASAGGLEFQYRHAVDGVQRHIHRGDLPAGRQREGVNRVAVGRLGRQNAAQPGFALGLDDARHRLAEQLWRRLAEDGVGIFARLQDRQIGQAQHQQRPMGLNAAGRADGLVIAVGDVDAVALDAVGLRVPRRGSGHIGRGLVGYGGWRAMQFHRDVLMHGDVFLFPAGSALIHTSNAGRRRWQWHWPRWCFQSVYPSRP